MKAYYSSTVTLVSRHDDLNMYKGNDAGSIPCGGCIFGQYMGLVHTQNRREFWFGSDL